MGCPGGSGAKSDGVFLLPGPLGYPLVFQKCRVPAFALAFGVTLWCNGNLQSGGGADGIGIGFGNPLFPLDDEGVCGGADGSGILGLHSSKSASQLSGPRIGSPLGSSPCASRLFHISWASRRDL